MSASEFLSVWQYTYASKAIIQKSHKKRENAYEDVCSAMGSLAGNLSDDIIRSRKD